MYDWTHSKVLYLWAFIKKHVPYSKKSGVWNVVDENRQKPIKCEEREVKVKMSEVWRNCRKLVVKEVNKDTLKIQSNI